MKEEEWIKTIDNLGVTASLTDLQEAICLCPPTLHRTPLYIFISAFFMGRAHSEGTLGGAVDIGLPPYAGPGSVEHVWNNESPKFDDLCAKF